MRHFSITHVPQQLWLPVVPQQLWCNALDVCLDGYRLWTSKQEQEKVPDEDATKRKQESADAKVPAWFRI